MGKIGYYGAYILASRKQNNGYAGGVFYELARMVIKRGGIVVGAAYTEKFDVDHMETDHMEALEKLAGVKYADSLISEKLKKKIKTNLHSGRIVLFAGTPCQVGSIYQYLDKEYENFYTIIIRCSGVIRSEVWRDYIDEVQAYGSIITEMYYPYRGEFGISQTKAMIKFQHGTAYFRDEKEDKLLKLKRAGLIFKEECYHCAWMPEDAKSDILLETYYRDTNRDADQEKGITKTSILTEKGMRLFSSIRSRMNIDEKIKEDTDREYVRLVQPEDYDYFWKYYGRYGFSYVSDLIMMKKDSIFCERILQDFLVKYVLLDANGITMEKILNNWGLEKIIIYGQGTVSKILVDKLRDSGRIYAVINKRSEKSSWDEYSIPMMGIDQIIKSEIPIIIPPLNFIPDVMEELIEKGVDKKRLLSLTMLINWEYENKILNGPCHTIWDVEKGGIGNIYLITGAQFGNKGAQSMLFVTVSELRRKHPECDIYYLPIDSVENYPDSILGKYRFHIIRDGLNIYSQFYNLIPQLKAIIDISGYALSSKWNCNYFITILMLAQNNNVPIYFMPQSFGPFDFEEDWNARIKDGLLHASMIFAREKKGYDLLIQQYGLKNVRMSRDLVLQNHRIIIKNIYSKDLELKDYELKTNCNVAIVPNTRNYEFGNKDELLYIYKNIIAKLLEKEKNIYILAHSDDEEICNDIYKICPDHEHVFLYKKELDCLEYSALVKGFQYIIASRYHAIVHSYKEIIPCVAIGWAEKYEELLSLFKQEKYVFDVRKKINVQKLMDAIEYMDKNWIQEKEKIKEILPMLQEENCFDVIE
jgi:Uncharacterized conserved protein